MSRHKKLKLKKIKIRDRRIRLIFKTITPVVLILLSLSTWSLIRSWFGSDLQVFIISAIATAILFVFGFIHKDKIFGVIKS